MKILAIFFACISNLIYAQDIFYTQQDLSLKEIQENQNEWLPYNKPIYKGFNNGVYWFRIELENNKPQILSLPESHISKVNLYYNSLEITRQQNTRYITYAVEPKPNNLTCFLRVNCLLEGRIPIKIEETKAYYQSELKEYMIIGIYVGLVLCIIILNMLSYTSFKEITYIHYIFMVIGMAINALYKDGITALLFGIEGINETLESTLNSVLVISAVFFSTSYLSLKKYLPKLRKLGICIAILAVLSNIFYLICCEFSLFVITDILYLIALDVFWFAGLLLWHKSPYAKFFTIAYGIPLLFAHDYYISPHFGITVLNLPLWLYKIGSIFEMVIFTYAIIYKSKELEIENKEIREKLISYANEFKSMNVEASQNEVTTDELIKIHKFTIREVEILKKVASKKTNKEIASQLFISENTVKFHMKNILQKLEVKNRKAASNKYLKITKSS